MSEEEPVSEERQAPEVEEVDALPVLADELPVPVPVRGSALTPVVAQAAAVAATGFVAGAATVAVIRRHRRRRAPARRLRRPSGDQLQVLGSRSFLVDVHLLGGRG